MNTLRLGWLEHNIMSGKILGLLIFITGLSSCHSDVEINKLLRQEINQGWEFRQYGTEVWFPATVPGSVHTDLLASKMINDPFFRLNEKKLQWVDKVDWEYRTVFQVNEDVLSREESVLIFEGLDTYAKVFLNGDLLFEADNMFRTWNVDVAGKLRSGENELMVLLESPTRKGLEALKKFGFQLAADNDQSENGEMGADRVSPYVRKAPYHFGWDWGPRLVTSGIWRPVKLKAWSKGRIEDVNIVVESLTDDIAELKIRVGLDVSVAGKYSVQISRDSITGFHVTRDMEHGTGNIEVPVTIHSPELWWSAGSGDQKLYDIKVELVHNEEVIDSEDVKTGIRDVKLVQEPDPDGKGRSFYFELNGKPVFAKGANYIPNDVFLNRVSPEEYEFIVKSAADANMNMLRVWGGGIYEDDLFYDLCDKYGIMVWQDFMFACSMYPGTDGFLESVRLEAVDNVKRLRNHPCIVLWCGNNEIEGAWGPYEENRGWGWKQRYNDEQRTIIWKAYDTLFHHILPGVIAQEDPARAYWHSSPSAGMGQLASYETTSGDMHYWGVWHGLHPLSDFRKYKTRFMSEYGFQSFPEFNSVKKYTLPADYDIESEVMMSHQRSGIGNLRIRQYMEEDYVIPDDFEHFLYVGQLLQAEAIKVAIESHRADMPYCMGSLYWQINDCWPVASWSGIDYYGRWKALHYFAREAFKPTVLTCSEDDDLFKIKMVTDDKETGNLKLEIRLIDFSGNILWESENEFEMPSQELTFSLKEILGKHDPASIVLVSKLIQGEDLIDTDLHYFVKPKKMKLNDPQINMEVNDIGGKIQVKLACVSLAKNVFLYADSLDEQFSDNYFDILPGDTVSVTIPKTEMLHERIPSLRIIHLFQTGN